MSFVYDNQDDRIEIGSSGFVTVRDGWMYNPNTRESMDPEGRIFDSDMELIYDPHEDDREYSAYDREDYEWYE